MNQPALIGATDLIAILDTSKRANGMYADPESIFQPDAPNIVTAILTMKPHI
jgi:hypothetical protein